MGRERHRHGEERFRAVASTLTDAVLVMDAEDRVLFANAEVEGIFGYAPDEIMGRSASVLFRGADLEAHESALARLRAEPGRPSRLERIEVTGLHRGGGTVPVEITYGSYDKGGEVFFTAIVRDLSERRRAESQLGFQARLLDAVGEAVIATDPGGRILYWNAAAERLYGWSAEEVLGESIEDVTPAGLSQARAAEIMALLREGETWAGEFMVRDRAGREFPVLVTDSPVHDDEGTLIGIIGTSKEITERKRMEESQRFLSEAGRVLASSLDHQTTLSRVSRLAVPMLGDWCAVHLLDSGRPEAVARCAPAGRDEDADRLEGVLTEPDGILDRVLPASDPVRVAPGEPALSGEAGARLAALDIRELLVVPLEFRGQPLGVMTFARPERAPPYDAEDIRLASELALRAASAIDNARLYRDAEESDRAKTDFLAVVSHELRTPLNAITGYAELLTGGISGELTEKQRNQVERIRVSARHLAQIIDEILTFARMERGRDTVEAETTDAARLVREAVSVLEPAARSKGLALTIDGPDEGPDLFTDPRKFRQIVVNLVGNAVKYTRTGSVEVALREDEQDIVLTVTDTGIGIAPEEQDRIFEPFRQVQSPNTRTAGGTGLGLSVTRQLVRLLGGVVTVDSMPGEGSTFTVRLPSRAPRGG